MIKLSVNVDHVATLRQARGTDYPRPLEAAKLAREAGASGITVHLRGDRRHIQESDVEAIRAAELGKLNLEMAATAEMIELAIGLRPDQVTLVPERSEEVTTEGGLDLLHVGAQILTCAEQLRGRGIDVSAFIDPHPDQVDWLAKEASSIIGGFEINTDRYACAPTATARDKELAEIRAVAALGSTRRLRVYAGHALTTANVLPIARVEPIEELNIGHFLVSRAVLVGMSQAVREMLAAMSVEGSES